MTGAAPGRCGAVVERKAKLQAHLLFPTSAPSLRDLGCDLLPFERTPPPPGPPEPGGQLAAELARRPRSGLEPADVAAQVLTAIREDELCVFTQPEMRAEAAERLTTILAAMDKAAAG